jgi:hypothetical protein
VTPVLLIAIAAPVAQAILSAAKADFPTPRPFATERFKLRALTALLHLIQPVARLKGRLEHGLTLWRERTTASPQWNLAARRELWSEEWGSPGDRLSDINTLAREQHKVVRVGGDYDDWDIELCGGMGDARLVMAVEEHGAGKEMLRFRYWMKLPTVVSVALGAGALLTILAATGDAWVAAGVIGLGVLVTAVFSLRQAARGMAVFNAVLTQYHVEKLSNHAESSANENARAVTTPEPDAAAKSVTDIAGQTRKST